MTGVQTCALPIWAWRKPLDALQLLAHSGEIVGFDDSLGKVVTLVTGTLAQTHRRLMLVTMLCVHDQRLGRAWTTEASGWRSPERQ